MENFFQVTVLISQINLNTFCPSKNKLVSRQWKFLEFGEVICFFVQKIEFLCFFLEKCFNFSI